MSYVHPLVVGFLVALGVGLLIGIDRERKKGDGPTRQAAGLRTFTLASLAGATAQRRKDEPAPARERPRTRRLGYLEQREWDQIEQAILDAEAAVATHERAAEDPSIASNPAALQERYAALESARAEVDRLYARWAELEAKLKEA